MKVQDLIAYLQTQDPDMDVVVRSGANHGANYVKKVCKWNGYKNPNYTNHRDAADLLLPENPNYPNADTVLVLC